MGVKPSQAEQAISDNIMCSQLLALSILVEHTHTAGVNLQPDTISASYLHLSAVAAGTHDHAVQQVDTRYAETSGTEGPQATLSHVALFECRAGLSTGCVGILKTAETGNMPLVASAS